MPQCTYQILFKSGKKFVDARTCVCTGAWTLRPALLGRLLPSASTNFFSWFERLRSRPKT